MNRSGQSEGHTTKTVNRIEPAVVLLLGGLTLISISMISGEVFAFFVSHNFNAEINTLWLSVVDDAAAGRVAAIEPRFEEIRELATGRGGVMSLHAHIGGFGLLCAALAVVLDRTSVRFRHDLAASLLFIVGAVLHAAGILIGYLTGVQSLWLAHVGSALMLMMLVLASIALLKARPAADERSAGPGVEEARGAEAAGREAILGWHKPLVHAGAFLLTAGMIFGVYLAGSHMFAEEPNLREAMEGMYQALHYGNAEAATGLFEEFKTIQTRMAITAAAHTHATSFGLLLMILGLMTHHMVLPDVLRQAAVTVAIVGACALPVFVYLAPRYGFGLAMGANSSGFLVLAGTLVFAGGVGVRLVREIRS